MEEDGGNDELCDWSDGLQVSTVPERPKNFIDDDEAK